MKVTKLRSLAAVALLMLPTVTLNAAVLPSAETAPTLGAPPAAGMCWINIGGKWYYLPC